MISPSTHVADAPSPYGVSPRCRHCSRETMQQTDFSHVHGQSWSGCLGTRSGRLPRLMQKQSHCCPRALSPSAGDQPDERLVMLDARCADVEKVSRILGDRQRGIPRFHPDRSLLPDRRRVILPQEMGPGTETGSLNYPIYGVDVLTDARRSPGYASRMFCSLLGDARFPFRILRSAFELVHIHLPSSQADGRRSRQSCLRTSRIISHLVLKSL